MQTATAWAIILRPVIYLAIVLGVVIPLRILVWRLYRYCSPRWREVLYRKLW